MKAPARMVAAWLLALVPLVAFAQPEVPPPPGPGPALTPPGPEASAPVDEEGMETLTRGPIHEAFANPADQDPKPSPAVPDKPPPDVPEQPPAYQPEGDFVWIPGYYEWDEDRRGFIWVTGVWRQPPPGKRWMPGYWHEVDGGWQRVRGFWVGDEVEQVAYQPAPPPASIESGPSSPQPADNYFWIPGNWNYVNANYAWQAGYWAPYQPNWVWIPARWLWTPAGYVFAPGYWDYRLANRGQIFAPVYFSGAIYTRPGWFYRPTVVIPTSNLFINLWLRPSYGSYYFGNYYGPQYASLGFMPWVNIGIYQRQRFFYDPFYSYAAVHYRRQGVDNLARWRSWHEYYVQNPNDRPPGTFREQQQWLVSHRNSAPAVTAQLTATHIAEAAQKTDAPLKLKKIDERTLQAQAEHAKQLREVDTVRKNLEREHAHVTTRLPTADNTVRNLDQTKIGPQDQTKTGPLVDRIDKKGKTGGDDGTKTDNTVKLNLPKIKPPPTVSTNIGASTGTGAGNITGAVRRDAAPPLPLASQGSSAAKTTTITPRTNLLPGTNNVGPGNAGKTGASNIGPGNIGTGNIGTGNIGQGTTRSGKTTGNLEGVPRTSNLPPGGFEPSGNTNRGGQPNVRNFQPPTFPQTGGDNKGGARADSSRGPGKSSGQSDAGSKGKKKDQ